MERYDLAIVGSGPAGLSAALNAKIRNKNFIIFGHSSADFLETSDFVESIFCDRSRNCASDAEHMDA